MNMPPMRRIDTVYLAYLVAVSELITALFSAVFQNAHPAPTAVAPVMTSQPDLQSKSVVSRSEVVASRDAKPAGKTPASARYSDRRFSLAGSRCRWR
jgi:hypothetical protein